LALVSDRLLIEEEWANDLVFQPADSAPLRPLLTQETAERGEAAAEGPAPEQHNGPSPWVPLGGLLAQVFYLGNLKPADTATDPEPAVEGLPAPADARLLIADLIQRSTEVFTQLIQSFYALFLGRETLAGEEQGWVGMLLAGRTQEDVLGAFLSTREFYDRARSLVPAGTPDERYIQALHQVLLHRAALPQEVSGYLSVLSGSLAGGMSGREILPSLLVRSVEYRTHEVETLYRSILGRSATAAEAAGWAASPFDLLSIRSFLAGQIPVLGGSLSSLGSGPAAD
jgi:hypothetical protein